AEPSDLQSDPFGRSGTPPQVRGAYYQIRQLCEPLLVISGDKKVRVGHFLISFAHFSSLSTTSTLIAGMKAASRPRVPALMEKHAMEIFPAFYTENMASSCNCDG
ncbi:hypothetical protein, partial [Aeromonas salmonicida]|uniref:hypothetical protein n=1 Tax=Aeromonas salmonicida TaxID=645 RepID=UPI001BAD1272